MIPVIMSGGCGTRLWPLSRKQKPKQFLPLVNNHTMFENTLLRLKGIANIEPPVVVCNEDHRFMVAEQLKQLGIENSTIALEPVGRNTAPAIAAAAFTALEKDPDSDPLLLVLAADHEITQVPAFHTAIAEAKEVALSGALVTFGIVPDSAHTGYGYIKAEEGKTGTAYKVEQFVEKPDQKTAEEYFSSGNYYWNSGMFMFKASVLLKELKQFSPDIIKACEAAVKKAETDMDFLRLHKESFIKSPSDSIDYALMEKTDKAKVVPLDAGWSDVGAWSSLWDISSKDNNNNVVKGDVITDSVQNSLIHSENKLVTVTGIDDVVVVETDDAVMIASKERSQDVKIIGDMLKQEGRDEINNHRKVYRPWGYYDSIDSGNRFQVKRIVVKPGEKLSVQMHHHRAEHWIVVSGTANVTKGDETFMVSENQSTYIPIGEVHALENPGTIPLEIIEVQSGSYLGEDDIVRFDDRYGRGSQIEDASQEVPATKQKDS
ncbi:MAG: mannose-1-phosphate guanylyltransferase/mannose-6-phosphate isomerase [Gammaproteobacteria bacterium]|nr:mannose-1-phosphate guanylyltransferase/mannose-6-phosphate isomerase [Gammaproteobacteria bacterium]